MQAGLWAPVLRQDSDEVRTSAACESLWLYAAAAGPRVLVHLWTGTLSWSVAPAAMGTARQFRRAAIK